MLSAYTLYENQIGVIAIAYKERTKPLQLRIYEILRFHMNLDNNDYYYYLNLKKGFVGECKFDKNTERLSSNFLKES